MLETTRRSLLFRANPLLSAWRLLNSKFLHRSQTQVVRLSDGVVLLAEAGHPNRCYAWTGELSLGVAATLASLLKPGMVFLDVGAFSGQHAIRAAKIVGESGLAIAIEPDPRARTRLMENVTHSDVASNVIVRPEAVTDSMHRKFLNLADLSTSYISDSNGIEIETILLDDLLETYHPSVVKIDIEGIDAAVIAASSALPSSENIILIVEENEGVCRALSEKGFEVKSIKALLGDQLADSCNVSPDVLAWKGSLDLQDLTEEIRRQVKRLRVPPLVSFLGRAQ